MTDKTKDKPDVPLKGKIPKAVNRFLNSCNEREKQILLHWLLACEQEGTTDIRFIRKHIYDHVFDKARIKKVRMSKSAREEAKRRQLKTSEARKIEKQHLYCPRCRSSRWYRELIDGVMIAECKKCRYSEYQGEVKG